MFFREKKNFRIFIKNNLSFSKALLNKLKQILNPPTEIHILQFYIVKIKEISKML